MHDIPKKGILHPREQLFADEQVYRTINAVMCGTLEKMENSSLSSA
jgi:hypothetical protein